MSKKQIRKEFGRLIKRWRLDRNIGMRDFAKIIEISPVLLSHIELGESAEESKQNLKESIKQGKVFLCREDDIFPKKEAEDE